MNVVDSSGWLEYFSNEENAKRFLAPLKDTASLVVPVITIYEVFKVALRERGDNPAFIVGCAIHVALGMLVIFICLLCIVIAFAILSLFAKCPQRKTSWRDNTFVAATTGKTLRSVIGPYCKGNETEDLGTPFDAQVPPRQNAKAINTWSTKL